MPRSPAFARLQRDLLRLVDALPAGRVTTMAALGACIDVPPRHVAYLLSRLPPAAQAGHPVHRVLRDGGRLPAEPPDAAQRLQHEGVAVSGGAVADLSRCFIDPRALAVPLEAAERPAVHRRGPQGEPALAELRGLGPRSVAALASIGITSTAQLRSADPYRVWLELRQRQPGTSLNMLYALIGAIDGRDWRVVAREDKLAILLRLDELGMAP